MAAEAVGEEGRIPDDHFEGQFLGITGAPRRRQRILDALFLHDVEGEADLVGIVTGFNRDQKITYFMEEYNLSRDDARSLTTAIHSSPQGRSIPSFLNLPSL